MAAGATRAAVGDGLGAVGEGLGAVGDGLGEGLGVGAGVDDFAIWSPVFLISGCLAGAFISAFGVGFSALLMSSFLAEFFAVSIPLLLAVSLLLLAASLSLSGFAARGSLVVLAVVFSLCFRSVTVRGLVATCGRGGGLGLGVKAVVVVVFTVSSAICFGVGDGFGLGVKAVVVVVFAVSSAICFGVGDGFGVGLGEGLAPPSRLGERGVAVGDGLGSAGEPKPKNSFNLEPKEGLGTGVGPASGSPEGRGLIFRESGGSGIIRGSSPPTSAEVRPSLSDDLGVGAERGEAPSELEDGSDRGIERSGSAWPLPGPVPFRNIS